MVAFDRGQWVSVFMRVQKHQQESVGDRVEVDVKRYQGNEMTHVAIKVASLSQIILY